jgi:hypothetical protein
MLRQSKALSAALTASSLRTARCAFSTSSSVDDSIPPERRHERPLRSTSYGVDILHDPLWNKGTAFNYVERDRLGLRGLIPPMVKTLDEQKKRVNRHLDSMATAEEKNMYLQDLANRNETLYFRVLGMFMRLGLSAETCVWSLLPMHILCVLRVRCQIFCL